MKPFSAKWTPEERLRIIDCVATSIIQVGNRRGIPGDEVLQYVGVMGLTLRATVRGSTQNLEDEREAMEFWALKFGPEQTGEDPRVDRFLEAQKQPKTQIRVGTSEDGVRLVMGTTDYTLSPEAARSVASSLRQMASAFDQGEGAVPLSGTNAPRCPRKPRRAR